MGTLCSEIVRQHLSQFWIEQLYYYKEVIWTKTVKELKF